MEKIILELIEKQNNTPIGDFEGLSSKQMQFLLYDLFGNNCAIQIKNDISDDTLDKISLFRIFEELLSIINRETKLKLTPKGNLQKKIVKEIYDKRYIIDDFIESSVSKNFVEHEFIFIHNVNMICRRLGLIKKLNGSLYLTAKGTKLLNKDKRHDFFRLILKSYISNFIWSFNDRYSDQMNGQFGFGFTLFLLFKYGNKEKPVQFYSEKYLTAFPKLIDNFSEESRLTKEYQFNMSYQVRAFERFLLWFNFIEITDTQLYDPPRSMKVIATKHLREVFQLNQ